jgi:hypothetical protein
MGGAPLLVVVVVVALLGVLASAGLYHLLCLLCGGRLGAALGCLLCRLGSR